MAKVLSSQTLSNIRSKGSVAAFAVVATSFSLTGFAAACGNGNYTSSYNTSSDWNHYNQKQNMKQGGYDYNKHGDSKNDWKQAVQQAGWHEDSNGSWGSSDQSQGSWGQDDSSDNQSWGQNEDNDQGDSGHQAQQASWHEDSSNNDDQNSGNCDSSSNDGNGHGSDWSQSDDHQDTNGGWNQGDDNGGDSYSKDSQVSQNSETSNKTDVNVGNNVDQSAMSGDASSSDNYDGGDVSTGHATNDATTETGVVVNNGSSDENGNGQMMTASMDESHDMSGWNSDDGNGSSYRSSSSYDSNREVTNVTNVTVNNNIKQYAVSGDADSSDNYWGGTVSTGNASNTANTATYVVVNN